MLNPKTPHKKRRILIPLLAFTCFSAAQARIRWQSIGPGGCGWFTTVAIDTTNPAVVFVGSDVGGVYKSTDDGWSWRIVNSGLTDYYIEKILPHPGLPGIVFLGTWGGVHKSTDRGETWQPKRTGFPPPGVYNYTAPIGALAIDPQNPSRIYAGIGMPRIGHTDVTRWRPVPTKGAIFKSTDYGETWRMIRNTGIDTTALISALVVDPESSQIVYAVAHTGVYKSVDGGENWVLKNHGLPHFSDTVFPRSLALNPENRQELYLTIISDTIPYWRGGVFKSTNGGEVWSACTTGLKPAKYIDIVINPRNPAVIYTGGTHYGAGGVYKTTNYGARWSKITSASNVQPGWVRFWGTPQPYSITINPADTAVLFYTSAEAVVRTTDAGLTWHQCYTESIGPDDNWKSRGLDVTCIRHIVIDPIDSNVIYVGLGDGGTWKSTDRGYSFKWIHDELLPYGNTCFYLALHPESTSILYAAVGPWVTDSGLLFKSTDGGQNFTLLDSTQLPQKTICPILVDPHHPEIIYLWVNRHGVYKTTDGGVTWNLKNNGLAITPSDSFLQARPHIMAMAPDDPSKLYLCVSRRGKVYQTANGGENWLPINLPANNIEPWGIAVHPSNPSKLYLWVRIWDQGLITLNRLYLSTDGGTTWLSEPLFELRGYQTQIRTLAISPFDSSLLVLGTTDYAYHDSSTGKGVFISTDGGATWEQANERLSCWRSFFLTFDPHNPNVIWLGTTGNGIFRGEYSLTGLNADGQKWNMEIPNKMGRTVFRHTIYHSPNHYPTQGEELFDAAGRRVMKLSPGVNDARHLSFGVYFVVSGAINGKSALTRILITK